MENVVSNAAGGVSEVVHETKYERPILTPVGNLHDLLAAGGTQNADPGAGANPPVCVSGGTILDNADC